MTKCGTAFRHFGISLVFLALAFCLLYALCVPVHACTPTATCDDPGTPAGAECATPTPTLSWDYDEAQQNDLIGYRVFWRVAPQTWDRSRSWTVECWIYTDEETGISSRTYCYGRDLDTPVQRSVEMPLQNVAFAVKPIDRAGVESADYSNDVLICMPTIWRGGPYN